MSTASDVADALVEIARAQLEACGRAPDRALVYHGTVPQVCCTDLGTLSIRLTSIYNGIERPGPEPKRWGAAASRPSADFTIRLDRCWPFPADTVDKILATDYSTPARLLIDDALAVWMRLWQVACSVELADLTGCASIAPGPVVPIPARGGCAAVEWPVSVSLRTTPDDLCPTVEIGS